MSSRPPPSRRAPSDLRGQAKVIHEVRRLVDEWRGFELGKASEPYPLEPPRYEAVRNGEQPVSPTTMVLLQHWFRREPHVVGVAPSAFGFKYWPHQRRLVETFIYLFEVRGVRRTEQLYELAGVDPLGPQRDPWTKLGGQLATGSGKTKMMSLVIAWAYLNAVLEGESKLGLGRHSILIAPGLFVRDRLLQDFFPPHGHPSVFMADPVVPQEFDNVWNLKVYSPETCPRTLDPHEGALVVTNYHQLLREREDSGSGERRELSQMDLLFETKDPDRLESIQSPLTERFTRSAGLLVLNDEAHHVWDEPGHVSFEQKAKEKAKLSGEDAETAMAWIRCIRKLNGGGDHPGRVGLQVDLSATLFEEQGSKQKAGKTAFKQAELFRHTTVHYGLAEAIGDGIVKKPILERVVVKNKKTGEPEPLVNQAAPNAWERYRNLIVTGIERWKKVRDQLADEGDPRKPLLFLLCDDKKEAREVVNYLTYGEPSYEDLSSQTPKGYQDNDGNTLFVETDPDGTKRSTVVEIHIGKKEEANEADWEKIRASVNAIDSDEIVDPERRLDEHGKPLTIPNPYNVVVSVMMLKEGWDVRNVKVIVPLRPCQSRTLTEQALGRGLRKMHPPILDDDGAAEVRSEDLFVIEHPSFSSIIEQIRDIIEEKSSDEIEHAREYVPILQNPEEEARLGADVRLVRFEGLVQAPTDWRKSFDMSKIPPLTPKLTWETENPEKLIDTFLKKALEHGEKEGQHFAISANPTYRDFDHVIEVAYAIPLLRELRASYQHKTAVKGVVQEFLERKTFALPAGIPLSFSAVIEAGDAKIALGNLARPEVMAGVKKALQPSLHAALNAERPAHEAVLSRRNASELSNYQALKKHIMNVKRSSFTSVAVDNKDELRVAVLLDNASDVVGWIYNHRTGVGYSIPYDSPQGYTANYYPDFIARARFGEVFHNFIIEVKGRLDDRDRKKARRGERYCELLSEYDGEPWHYLMLIENEPVGRKDISWWEDVSDRDIANVLRRHEGLPLLPEAGSTPPKSEFKVVKNVPANEQFTEALPVFDLALAAGNFGESNVPEPIGWSKYRPSRPMERTMFIAQVNGESMEPKIPNGSWALFRYFEAGSTPSATTLDGRRVVVQFRDATDPETGGRYTLKRWKVSRLRPDGGVEQIELQPDNTKFKLKRYTAADGDIRVVAEFLEVVG